MTTTVTINPNGHRTAATINRDGIETTDVLDPNTETVLHVYGCHSVRVHEVHGLEAVQTGERLTYGGKAVGLTFNPSADQAVHRLKTLFANVIDEMNELRGRSTDPEVKRLASHAITEAQGAQMWAVKAATWRP